MKPLTRRSFLNRAAWAGAGMALAPKSWARVPGANSDIRVAVVGLGCGPLNRGMVHVKHYRRIRGVRLVALCDVDSAVLDRRAHELRGEGLALDTYRDVRDLISREDIDAVSIATPNHWHSLLGIWACQAGKAAYVEKPVSHNLWEGRQMLHAIARSGAVVQAGTQMRSNESVREAVAWVRAGNLGAIRGARALCFKRRPSIGLTYGPQPVPATVDYNLWSGPAPLVPPRRKRFHYDWHWFWPTGAGDTGNTGVHYLDVARWFLGEPLLPRRAMTVGGRLGYRDDGQTPNTAVAVLDYDAAPLIFELRGLPAKAGGETMDTLRGVGEGGLIECEGGWVTYGRATRAFDRDGKLLKDFGNPGDFLHAHFENFIACARDRTPQHLRCPMAEGHVSTGLAHLANISYRLGRQTRPEEIADRGSAMPGLSEAFGRMREHLAANGVDLERTPAALGEPLVFAPERERFEDNAPADALLRRDGRPPFTIPDLSHA